MKRHRRRNVATQNSIAGKIYTKKKKEKKKEDRRSVVDSVLAAASRNKVEQAVCSRSEI